MTSSKTVTIKRSKFFISGKKEAEIALLLDDSSRIIGSCYQDFAKYKFVGKEKKANLPRNSGIINDKPNMGIPLELAKLLFAQITDADDKQFMTSLYNYYHTLHIEIPDEGTVFEIGLSENNDNDVSETNLPIDIESYMQFMACKNHPHVADNLEQAKANTNYLYYIEDEDALRTITEAKLNKTKEANTHFISIENDPEKVQAVLAMYGEDVQHRNPTDNRHLLSVFVQNSPETYLQIVSDSQLAKKVFIQKLIFKGVITRVGDLLSYKDDLNFTELGYSLEEVIAKVWNPANAGLYNVLKGKLNSGNSLV